MKWTSKGNKTLIQYGFPPLYHNLQDKICEEKRKMANLKETAKESVVYTKTPTIDEAGAIDVNLEVITEERETKEGEKYTVNLLEVNKVKYRVPYTVLTDIKAILKEKPDLGKVLVSKAGEGKNTKYTVIPL